MAAETSSWLNSAFASNLLSSFIFICTLFFLRLVAERRIHDTQPQWTTEERLKSIGTLRTTVTTVVVVGLFYIWAEALHAFVVSVFAIALACVVATKELILCVHGYILLLRGKFYQLGDRIEVAGARGDVVNISILSTTILEVGHGHHGHQKTGRQLAFSNSILLNHFIHNESAFENFAMITVSVPLHFTQDWQLAKSFLLESAQKECESFLEHARKKMREIQRKRGIDLPSSEPRVNIDLPNHEEIVLHLRVPCPLHLRESVEQAILNRFMEKLAEARIKGFNSRPICTENMFNRPETIPGSASPGTNSSLSESPASVSPSKAKIPILDA